MTPLEKRVQLKKQAAIRLGRSTATAGMSEVDRRAYVENDHESRRGTGFGTQRRTAPRVGFEFDPEYRKPGT